MQPSKGYVDPDYLKKISKIVNEYKQRSYQLMHITEGNKVLDVGCGSGIDTIKLAELVGFKGQVIGIDNDPGMILAADQSISANGLKKIIRHQIADSQSLPFDDAFFDSSRCERVFQHLENPEKTFSEMVRVTKPGGRVVVLDTDWNTLSFDTSETDIENRLNQFRLKHFLNNGYSGRQLFRMFNVQGLRNIAIEICPIFLTNYTIARQGALLDTLEKNALLSNILTSMELKRWHKDLENRDERGLFFSSLNQIMLSATKQ